MDLRTVLKVIPRYHPVYSEVPADVIAEVDERYAQGTFRNWASFTHSVLAYTSGTLTTQTARDLLELHACGRVPAA